MLEVLGPWLERVAAWVNGRELWLSAIAGQLMLLWVLVRMRRSQRARAAQRSAPSPAAAALPDLSWPPEPGDESSTAPTSPASLRLTSDIFDISDITTGGGRRRPSTITEIASRVYWSDAAVPSWLHQPPPVPRDAPPRETGVWDPETRLETCWQRKVRRLRTSGELEATTVRLRISPFDVPTGVYPNEFGLAILEEKRLSQRQRASDGEGESSDVDRRGLADNAPRHG